MLPKAPRRGGYALVQKGEAAPRMDFAHEFEVLENGNVRVAACLLEHAAAHKASPVPEAQERQRQARAPGVKAKQGSRAVKGELEGAARAGGIGEGGQRAFEAAGRQQRIRMQKKQNVSAGPGGAGVHLPGASARRRDDLRVLAGDGGCFVPRAPVCDDDFVRGRLLPDGLQGLFDAFRLVQRRHYDRNERFRLHFYQKVSFMQ